MQLSFDHTDFNALFEDLARSEIRRAAKDSKGAAKVFEIRGAPGARLVRFFAAEYTPYIQVGQLPTTLAHNDVAFHAFQQAHTNPHALDEITDPDLRKSALKALILALQHKEDNLLEFMVPQSSMRRAEKPTAAPDSVDGPGASGPQATGADAQSKRAPAGGAQTSKPASKPNPQGTQKRQDESCEPGPNRGASNTKSPSQKMPNAGVVGEGEKGQARAESSARETVPPRPTRPASNPATGPSTHTAGHAAQGVTESEEPLDNELASFWTIANEILYEEPPEGMYGTQSFVAYRVWGCPAATLVARYFDGGHTCAMGALIDEAYEDDSVLNAAITRLIETRGTQMPEVPGGGTPGARALRELHGAQMSAHLGALLKRYRDQGGLVFQTGVQGKPSLTTSEHLERIRRTYSRVKNTAPVKMSMFQVIANLYLEDARGGRQLSWSAARELADKERIEVLGHAVHPRALLLIYFEPARSTRCAALYMPPAKEPMAAMMFCSKATALLEERQLSAEVALELPLGNEFTRIAPAQAVTLLEESLDLIDDEIGTTYEFPLRGDSQDLSDRVVLTSN